MFTDHMVLQREIKLPVWGWAAPGEKVVVSIGNQTHSTTAGDDGQWQVELAPMAATTDPLTLVVEGSNRVAFQDVLVGEVWVCSGQSNMQWPVNASWNADLERLSANHPAIRLLTIENAGVQKPIQDFQGQWQVCTPETVGDFSAVGYFFGVQLQQILQVPVGLIDNSWGGSACEAWVRRDKLQQSPDQYAALLQRWADKEAQADQQQPYLAYETALLKWQQDAIAAKQSGSPIPEQPPRPNGDMVTQHRPGNLYNGRVEPIIPFAIRGVIWYQGETNASRAYQYRHMFPLMIRNWREGWQQGDFPFYWVQLADFQDEKSQPGDSDWAELREAQSMTQDVLPHTGEAVIIDIGEAADIHPRNKLEVGRRLARLALANQYGVEMAHRSPRFAAMRVQDGKVVLTFKDVGGGLRTVDKRELLGFAIAAEDRQWHVAQAKLLDGAQVEVSCDCVTAPVAVRYAWADNPVCNVYSAEGLPLTPFRTDDWPGVTADRR
jgi:sialate O-acetylesterase